MPEVTTYQDLGEDPDPKSLKRKLGRSRTVRTFGRALTFFGNGARAVFAQPMKVAAGRKRRAEPFQVQDTALPLAPPSRQQNSFQTMREGWADNLQQTHQRLTHQLQDSAEFIKRSLPLPTAGTAGFLAANCFPPRLLARARESSLAVSDAAQDLISTGSRSLLRIKLYDFAIYLDKKDVAKSGLKKKQARREALQLRGEESELPLSRGIRDSGDIEMSLLVRAARNLPIALMIKEYERILKRRMRVVGGSPNDPALRTMLEQFTEQNLPEDIRSGGSVKKGVVLAFTRDQQGNVQAQANHHKLVTVQSQKLAQAVFDIYLGDQVVCTNARRDSAIGFLKMLDGSEYQPPTSNLVCEHEACRLGKL